MSNLYMQQTIEFPPSREDIMQNIAKLREPIQHLKYLEAAGINKVSINFFFNTGSGLHEFNKPDQDILLFLPTKLLSILIADSILELENLLMAL